MRDNAFKKIWNLCSCAFNKTSTLTLAFKQTIGNIPACFPHTLLRSSNLSRRRRCHGAPHYTKRTAPTPAHRYIAGRSVQFAFAYAPVRLCSKVKTAIRLDSGTAVVPTKYFSSSPCMNWKNRRSDMDACALVLYIHFIALSLNRRYAYWSLYLCVFLV